MDREMLSFPERAESARLYLGRYRAGDGPMYFSASQRNAAHLAQFESDNVMMGLNDQASAEAVLSDVSASWAAHEAFFLGLFDKHTGDWAGQVYVAPTNLDLPEFTIGYVADINYEGRGYISEAVTFVLRVLFTKIGAQRVRSDCHEDNTRSWRLLERVGFKREGHLRENKRNADGSLHGDYLYGLLRREFGAPLISRADDAGALKRLPILQDCSQGRGMSAKPALARQ